MSIYYPCRPRRLRRYSNHMANLSTQPFLSLSLVAHITFDLINFVNVKTQRRKNNDDDLFQT